MERPHELVHGLRQQIADQLRKEVLSGRLPAGQRLSEKELTARFRVSRTPIREALQQLAHEGIVEAKPNCGVRVAPGAPLAIRELVIPIRRSIEVHALWLFHDEITEEDYACWEEILQRMHKACMADDTATVSEQDIAFHQSIIRRAGQPDLEAIWAVLVARVRSHFEETHPKYDDLVDVYREHRAVVDAFRQGDLTAATAALAENIA